MLRHHLVLSIVSAVLLTSCTSESSSPQNDEPAVTRSTESFCSTLDTGFQQMQNNADQGSFEDVLLNIGEFTTLVHQLDEVAPAEISTQMADARELWDEQQQVVEKAASDPVAALASAAVGQVFAAASIRDVDQFAATNCGMSVFGTVAVNAFSSMSWQCPTEGVFADLDNSYTSLYSELSTMASSDMPSVAPVASRMMQAVGSLDPEPVLANEALMRLSFEGVDPLLFLTDLDAALQSDCAADSVLPELEEFIANLSPRPLYLDEGSDALVTSGVAVDDSLYGLYCEPVGAVSVGFTYLCDSDVFADGPQFATVNYTTGAVSIFEAPQFETDDTFDSLTTTGDKIIWVESFTAEASGLNPATWRSELVQVDAVTGSEVYRVDVAKGAGREIYAPSVEYAWPDGTVLTYSASGLTVFDASGQKLWGSKVDVFNSNSGSFEQVTEHSFLIDSRKLIDRDTGETIATVSTDKYSFVEVIDASICGDVATLTSSSSGATLVTESPNGKVSVETITSKKAEQLGLYDDYLSHQLVEGALLVEDNGGLVGYSADGEKLWELDSEVVANYFVLGDKLIVVNQADEQILVDPSSGQDVTSQFSNVSVLFDGTFYDPFIPWLDQDAVRVQGSSPIDGVTAVAVQLDRQDICR